MIRDQIILSNEAFHEKCRDEAQARYESLFGELVSALLNDPTEKVSTPGWPRGESPAFDVLIDEMSGVNSDEMRAHLARVLQIAATQRENQKLQELALGLVTKVSERYAEAAV
jgi:hypothetical protein